MIKLSDIATINPENIAKTNEINYIDISSVGSGDIYQIKNIKHDFPSRAKRRIRKNDIIISTVRPNLKSYALIENDIDNLVCSTGFVVIRPKETIYKNILYYMLTSKKSFNFYEKNCEGSNYPSFKGNILNEMEFSEIKSINNVLKILNNKILIINKIKKLLEKIEIRNQYYAEKLINGELYIEENKIKENTNHTLKMILLNNREVYINSNFNTEKIKNIFSVSRGKVISKEYIEKNIGEYPVYSSATLNNGEIGKINSYQFDGKYITWTTDGVYAGTVFYRNGKFNCTNICGILKIKSEGNLKYFSLILKQYLPLFVTKLGNSKLMSNTVENIEIPFTTNIENQNKIAHFLEKLEFEKEKIEKLLSLEEQRFEWLSDKLLSGEYIIED